MQTMSHIDKVAANVELKRTHAAYLKELAVFQACVDKYVPVFEMLARDIIHKHRLTVLVAVNGRIGYLSDQWTPLIWINADHISENGDIDLTKDKTTLEQVLALKEELETLDFFVVDIEFKQPPKRKRRAEDIKHFYPEHEIEHSGEIWYKGWDIPDVFFILVHKEDRSKRLFLASVDGHGGDVEEFDDLDRFFRLIEQDSDNVGIRDAMGISGACA